MSSPHPPRPPAVPPFPRGKVRRVIRRGRRPRRPAGGQRPPLPFLSCRLTTSAGAEVGAPSRRALRKKASPFQGEAVERSETDEGAHGGDAPLIAPSSGPSGHLPPPLWGEGLRCVQEAAPSSSQAPYAPGRPLLALWANSPSRSLPPDGESSLIPLLVLSPRDPLRWARAGTPDTAAKSPKRRLETYGF